MTASSHSHLRAGPLGADDRYLLEEVVSSGMEGRLWRSKLVVDGHLFQVAVKEIHTQNLADLSEWVRRWERQAELLRSLDHPHLVRVREVFRGWPAHREGERNAGEESLFLVMNWAQGSHLGRWIEGRDLRQRLTVLGKVASAIDHLHSGRDTNGVAVMHRDLKPANIIVDEGGNPRIVDFGFARLAEGEDYTVVGSPHFMAPEIPLGAAPTPASDRFSFGCIVHTALLGHRVQLHDADALRANLAHLLHLGVAPHLVDHLGALLDAEPDRRPPDLSAWFDQPVDDTVPAAAPTGAPPLAPRPIPTVPSNPPLHAHGAFGSGVAPPSFPPHSMSSPPSIIVTPPSRAGWAAPVAVGLVVILLAVAAIAYVTIGRSEVAAPETTTTSTSVPEVVRLPGVAGMPADEARATLERMGFEVLADRVVQDAPEPAGQVLRVDPPEGTELRSGEQVTLVVAPPSFRMPELVGLTLTEARERLRSKGHDPDRVRVDPPGAAGDAQVLIQRPSEGGPSDKHGVVILTVPRPTTTTTTTTTPPPPPTDVPGTPSLPPPTAPPVG